MARPGRQILSHAQDVHCVIFHLATLAAYAAAFWLWLHPDVAGLRGPWSRTAFVAGAVPLLGWIGAVDVGVNFHNHTHRRIFTIAWLNRWFARTWTPTAGWPAAWWQYLHVAVHHAHLLQERDWTLPRRGADGRFESCVSYQLRHWPWRTAMHFGRDLRAGRFDRRVACRELAWFLVLWSIPFWIDPWMGVWLWALPHGFANVVTLGRGMYVQHAGCEAWPRDPRARHSNDFPAPGYNRLMFHIGFHEEHHDAPRCHWSELPRMHAERQRERAPGA